VSPLRSLGHAGPPRNRQTGAPGFYAGTGLPVGRERRLDPWMRCLPRLV